MFVLFNDCDDELFTVGADAHFSLHQSIETGDESVRIMTPRRHQPIFSGTHEECKAFMKALFFAMRDCKSATVSELCTAARMDIEGVEL